LANLLGDHRKLLQRRDDDRFSRFEGFLELARRSVDVLDDAKRLLELAHRRLELAIEHAAVGDNNDRVEHTPVGGVVESGQSVGKPGDGKALAATCRVLNQVTLPGSIVAGVTYQFADGIKLLVARKDQEAPAGFTSILVLFFDLVDE